VNGRVLVTDTVFGDIEFEQEVLGGEGLDAVLAPSSDEQTLTELAGEADAVMVCFAQITRPVVEAAARAGVPVIARTGIGYDNIDLQAAAEAGITVTYVPDYCLDEVADHTMALVLAHARGIVRGVDLLREDGWGVADKGLRRLRGRRLALVGVGQIGRRVAERARAFGLEVTAHDPYLEDWSTLPAERAETLEDALAEADFVSLHAPLTDATHHVIDAAAIAAMRRAPLVVNTARGPLVDLDAALEGLDSGKLGGLAVDVTEPEPLPDGHPLRTHPKAVVTPHMAFYSVEAQEELRRRSCEEVLRALKGQEPDSPVPLPSVAGGS